VVSNPEFLREGSAVNDLMKPDRIVIGVTGDRPVAAMKKMYEPFKAPVIVTDINSAELIKHASNSFLALKISYANALSTICEASGANILDVVNGMGMDKRIGRSFLDAGLGYGGSCFPKDLSAFIAIAHELGYDFRLLKEVQRINAEQMERLLKKMRETLWVLKEKTIAMLGLTFKPNTDDVRNSIAMDLAQRLQKEGARVRAYDPKGMEKARELLPDVAYCKDAYEACAGSDAVVLATEWAEFSSLNLEKIRDTMTHPIVFDGRNVFDPNKMKALGYVYKSVGR
jgi:UDPglucose 6-dehydrogenase